MVCCRGLRRDRKATMGWVERGCGGERTTKMDQLCDCEDLRLFHPLLPIDRYGKLMKEDRGFISCRHSSLHPLVEAKKRKDPRTVVLQSGNEGLRF